MPNTTHPVVLVTVSGPDRPGITAQLTGILAQSKARILDIGQAVIYGQLSLTILFELPPSEASNKATIKDLLYTASEWGLKLDFQVFDLGQRTSQTLPMAGSADAADHRYAITLISEPVTAEVLHDVSGILAKHGCNIDRIRRLSHQEFGCVEMQVSSTKPLAQSDGALALKKDLLAIAQQKGVDIALQAEGLFRRTKRLVVMDMDSTLIQNEVIDEFAREMGSYESVAAITEAAMRGEMDYDESLRQRCEKLKGLTQSQIDRVYLRLQLTPGADELIRVLKLLGYKIALISGGFSEIAVRMQKRLGIDYAHANVMIMKEGRFTGNIQAPIINARMKADLLEQIAVREKIPLDQVIAVGDGANDLLMLEKAGLGIAFNAKPSVRAQANTAINRQSLRPILYLLGFNARDIAEALQSG